VGGEGWWEMLVMLQFVTSSVILRQPIYSRLAGSSPMEKLSIVIYCDNLCSVKIHADKIEGGPPHALRVRDVRLIFATVPRDWTKEIKEVRIANSLEWHSHTYFARYDGCLTIYSRNRTKRHALTAVLTELAAISLGTDCGLRHRPKAVRDRLEKMAAPYMQELLPQIAPLPDLIERVSMEGFKEMQFPFVPNDVE
jgi:hypothetical protein